jgi:glycosyltransferase involved in cell wall biosynthesis
LAALEAMSLGVPVISSNTGGIPEVNIHGETGFLSDVGDLDDMTKNALHIIQNKETHDKFRKNAFARAKFFDIDKIVQKYENLYQRVLDKKP